MRELGRWAREKRKPNKGRASEWEPLWVSGAQFCWRNGVEYASELVLPLTPGEK